MPALENVREDSTVSIKDDTASFETTPVLITVSSMSSAYGPSSPSSSCNGMTPSLHRVSAVNDSKSDQTHSASAASVSAIERNSGSSDARSSVRDTFSWILKSRSLLNDQ